jgi:hypothetical protein
MTHENNDNSALPESSATEIWREVVAYCNFLSRNTLYSGQRPPIEGVLTRAKAKDSTGFFNSPVRGNSKWKRKDK